MSEWIFDLPPGISGVSTEKQLNDLRNYLVRMVRQLNAAGSSLSGTVVSSGPNGVILSQGEQKSTGDVSEAIEVIRKQGSTLRSLIQKTANDVYSYIDQIETQLESNYLAKSEFGEYSETIQTNILQTAKATVESYNYQEQINELNGDLDTIGSYLTTIQGEIRRGFIDVGGETYFGIAISDKLNFTGTIRQEEGVNYYEISDLQSFGLYTARGWMFFLNGIKVGWFDSNDGMLHVENIAVEDTITMGDWLISTSGGWGIRYIGDTE